ncbi:hypothetical protein QBC46DRAFT_447257 [Diplogelasinospora grovesii]|uniref:Uncharacterized protein n=1 Tax=Diplogelasinospora grovesii TaxID=303347 RepID=A0AAN6S7I9_9PEZI|nr:hypothetical protein QBC46DRAFT_447257 [Diplogelasinospora grovesii]
MNFTIVVPEGSTNHGNPKLLCTPPAWYDYVLFYFANYFAHAATVISYPGQGGFETVAVAVSALMLPVSGFTRAANAIYRRARFESNPLKRAARARALCMVVKSLESLPESQQGERLLSDDHPSFLKLLSSLLTMSHRSKHWWSPEVIKKVPLDYNIHGPYSLEHKQGYILAFVPSDAPLEFESPEYTRQLKQAKGFAESYNAPKLLMSLIQAIWAIIVKNCGSDCCQPKRIPGDQIDQYGYAAFGLTVAPYAWMSVLNILGNILTPDYPAVFMLRTPLMDEVEERKLGKFEGELRVKIDYSRSYEPDPDWVDFEGSVVVLSTFVFGLIPLAIIGGLSGFRSQNSTPLQRGFTMSWLAVGFIIGLVQGGLMNDPNEIGDSDLRFGIIPTTIVLLGVPAIGGMVVVGQMIHDFGIYCAMRHWSRQVGELVSALRGRPDYSAPQHQQLHHESNAGPVQAGKGADVGSN